MAHRTHGNAFDDAMEMLIENGFDSMAEVLKILLNEAMKIEREDCLAAKNIRNTIFQLLVFYACFFDTVDIITVIIKSYPGLPGFRSFAF